jgi:hypothetical protein
MTNQSNIITVHSFGVLFMGNKPIGTETDPLVLVQYKILRSQKDFLDNLGGSSAASIRKLISAQMSGHEVEISKLQEENKQLEAKLNINKAKIIELDKTDQRKILASQTREELIREALVRLKSSLYDINFPSMLKVNVELINKR